MMDDPKTSTPNHLQERATLKTQALLSRKKHGKSVMVPTASQSHQQSSTGGAPQLTTQWGSLFDFI